MLFVPVKSRSLDEHEIRPIVCLLPEAYAQNLKLIQSIEATCRVVGCRSCFLCFNLVSDNLPFGSIGLISVPDIFSFG